MAERFWDDERSPDASAFIDAVVDLCREHGFQILHEDSGGAFVVERGDDLLDWFGDAHEEREEATDG